METRGVLLIFLFELEISGVAVQRIHQKSKECSFCEDLLSENDFEAVLATFCCYDYGVNAFEVVQKIATDQKRLTQKLIVCYSSPNSQNIYSSITVKKGWLLGHLLRS